MLLVTLGDPYSINIRGVVQTLHATKDLQNLMPVVIIGSYFQWQDQLQILRSKGLLSSAPDVENSLKMKVTQELPEGKGLWFLDLGGAEVSYDALSQEERSRQSVAALCAIPKSHTIMAVVTGPVDKNIVSLTWKNFRGQTEYFSELWGSDALMLLSGPKLKVGLATNHMALSEVPTHITASLLQDKVAKFTQALQEIYGISKPRLAVCGLNPHAGDQGLFGNEDKTVIEAFVRSYKGPASLTGPISADTVFHFALKGRFDGVLAMYHDQGLTPMKTIYFEEAINISAGLPFLRVSPDHGPASDMILSPEASFKSFENAMASAIGYLEKTLFGKEDLWK